MIVRVSVVLRGTILLLYDDPLVLQQILTYGIDFFSRGQSTVLWTRPIGFRVRSVAFDKETDSFE